MMMRNTTTTTKLFLYVSLTLLLFTTSTTTTNLFVKANEEKSSNNNNKEQLDAMEYQAIFEAAAKTIDFHFARKWAYTENTVEDKKATQAQYDPRRPRGQKWILELVDGREPTDAERSEYKQSDFGMTSQSTLDDMAKPGSMTLKEETEDYWLLSFEPPSDEEEKFMVGKLDSTVKIRKGSSSSSDNKNWIEYVDMTNNAPIKTGMGVEITELVTHLSFGPAVPEGPIVPLTTETRVKGKAMIVMSVEEGEYKENSNFVYVAGDQTCNIEDKWCREAATTTTTTTKE